MIARRSGCIPRRPVRVFVRKECRWKDMRGGLCLAVDSNIMKVNFDIFICLSYPFFNTFKMKICVPSHNKIVMPIKFCTTTDSQMEF